MPSINGTIYPEIESAGLLNYRFKILIDFKEEPRELTPFILKLGVLKDYLKDINSPAELEIFTTAVTPHNEHIWTHIEPILLKKEISNYTERITVLAKTIAADLVITENNEIIDSLANNEISYLVGNYATAKKNIEVFVRGHEIPWSFSNPLWNMPWDTFYPMCDEFGKKACSMYNDFNKLALDDNTLELIRSLLLNRVSHVCHTRDKLLFYTQQKRFAQRNKWKRQNFHFEAAYYLCHYYLLFWGGTDQLSRVLNNCLNLGLERHKIGVGKKAFVDKVAKMDDSLGNLYKNEEFKDWVDKLKDKRHYVAHEGSIRLAPLMKQPEKELSDEELDKELRADPMWHKMKSMFTKEEFKQYHINARELHRISKYKVLVDDVMFINYGQKKYWYRPLNDIEWDFNNFKSITIKTLERLYKLMQNK